MVWFVYPAKHPEERPDKTIYTIENVQMTADE